MTPIVILVERLPHAQGLPLPARMTIGSAGADLFAAVQSDTVIMPGGRAMIGTGIKLAIPEGHEGQVRPRSGLAWKHGVTVLNAPGTIDSDYRGEVCVILINLGQTPFTVRHGDRIAQLVIAPVITASFTEVDGVSRSERGEGGFGHTGV